MTITRQRLKGAYSEGEALAIYQEVKQKGDVLVLSRTDGRTATHY